MTKILYVHSSLYLGGAQSVRYMFLKNLNQESFDVTVCCLGQKGEFGERIEKLGYKVDCFNKQDGLFKFSTTLRLYRYLKENKFDIVHSSLFYANYHSALAAMLSGVRHLVIEEHGEHNLLLKMRHFPYRAIGKIAAIRSSAIICCSNFVRDGVRRMYGIRDEKLVTAKNLVDDIRLQITRSSKEIRSQLDIPFDARIIGTVASLSWVKNQKILFELIACPDNDQLFLVIAGDGPLKNELALYAKKLGVEKRVRILGWRQDIADILNTLDIFMLPSLSEGIPVCLLEAMSIGLPCIASRVGGVEEVIEHKVTGMLAGAGNAEDLNVCLKQLIKDKNFSENLGLNARKFVMNNFKPSVYVKKVTALYKMFLNN